MGKNIKVISDISFHPKFQLGTSAWVIKPDDSDICITGNNMVPGVHEIQYAHCSELSGLIGAIHHINSIFKLHNIIPVKLLI